MHNKLKILSHLEFVLGRNYYLWVMVGRIRWGRERKKHQTAPLPPKCAASTTLRYKPVYGLNKQTPDNPFFIHVYTVAMISPNVWKEVGIDQYQKDDFTEK